MGEAVDRPDNPLADWLTLPDVAVLPVWARSTASIVANVTALGRLTWWHTRYHGLRTPESLFKTVLLAVRGDYRACVGLWPALSAQDHSAAVKALRAQAKARPEDVELAVRLQIAHAERTRTRRWRFGAAATGRGRRGGRHHPRASAPSGRYGSRHSHPARAPRTRQGNPPARPRHTAAAGGPVRPAAQRRPARRRPAQARSGRTTRSGRGCRASWGRCGTGRDGP